MQYRILLLAAVVCASCARPLTSPDGRLSAEVDGQTIKVFYDGHDMDKCQVTDVHVGLVTSEVNLDNELRLKGISSKPTMDRSSGML